VLPLHYSPKYQRVIYTGCEKSARKIKNRRQNTEHRTQDSEDRRKTGKKESENVSEDGNLPKWHS
jgi:hypothetical protein